MKTLAHLLIEYPFLRDVPNKTLESIQLDAAKSALELAAKQADELTAMAKCDISCPCRESVRAYEKAILTIANDPNLLEKLNK